MVITEVRVKVMQDAHLKAFCSITFDHCFVVRDLKIIHGPRGLFVVMPDRRLTDRCDCCFHKNRLQAHFCDHCGKNLPEGRYTLSLGGRPNLYADVAHPTSQKFRDVIQQAVLKEYEKELATPGSTILYKIAEDEIKDRQANDWPSSYDVELTD